MNKKIIKRSVLKTKLRSLPKFKYDIETSVKLLLSCAKQRQFISFIEFNRFYKIPDQDWPLVYPLLYRHLNLVLKFCSENNLPPLSVLVVARNMKNSGKMTQRQITRLRKAFERYGKKWEQEMNEVQDMDDLHKLQKLCFDSAIEINFPPKQKLDLFAENIR
jgi:hypothetical protein